jgi:hypothetical protein
VNVGYGSDDPPVGKPMMVVAGSPMARSPGQAKAMKVGICDPFTIQPRLVCNNTLSTLGELE